MLPRTVTPLLLSLCLALVVAAAASARPQVTTLDLGLRAGGFYTGLPPAAEVGATTGRAALGVRSLRLGATGWDVAELQLALAWQGFPSGTFDGRFGPRLESALTRFQQSAAIRATGIAGPATLAALRKEPKVAPIPLVWPVLAPLGDGFGPRGDSFHAGIDLLAPAGTDVIAAAPGTVTWAAPRAGGWGNLVTIAHGHGLRTMYAHLSVIKVRVGQWVAGGTVLGRVGATGDATGPHLHFEVRIGNAAIDPLHALVPLPASR
jgi:murein DD-endopeptidase MepM/ murein hydrolase activator NlpD